MSEEVKNEAVVATEPKTVAVAQKKTTMSIKGMLANPDTAWGKELSKVLPSPSDVARFMACAMSQLADPKNGAKLTACTLSSFYNAIMKSARSGIVPDGVNGYLIPYGNECTLQFSYRGLCDMAIRERIATRFKADVVYSNDEFEWENAELKKHIPAGWDEEERGRIVGVWVGACIDDGTWVYERMSYKEIELVRSKSQNKNGVWATWWGEMAKKACLKRLFKKMRNTPSMQEAVNIDNESFKFNENVMDAIPHAGVKKNIAALSSPIAALSAPNVEERSQTIELTHEKVSEPVVEEEPLPFE